MSISVVCLAPDAWERHRAIRLEALATAPDMYSTRYEDMEGQSEGWWREIMAKNRYFYAESDGELVGLAGLATPSGALVPSADKGAARTEELAAGGGMLISVFVSAKARGLGIGERLSEAVIAQAKAEGLAELFLEVAEHNAVARTIYTKLGFVFTGRGRPTECAGQDHQELEMVLEL